jgi:hypothetical protein
MADDTGKTTPPSDPRSTEKPANKPGPVKPPVLEGTARPGAAGKPGDSTAPDKAAKPLGDRPAASTTVPKPRPDADEPQSRGGNPWLAGLLGGAIGLGAAYGLAWYGLWPTPPETPVPADPRLAEFATAIPELETVTSTVQDELSTLTGRVGALETAAAQTSPAQGAGTDPAVTQELAALAARLDELAAASAQPSDTADLDGLAAEIETLRAETAATAAQLAEANQQLASLSQSASDQAGADAATIRLPLIFSGLESAFLSGRPFETELAVLRQALPETLVPEAVAGRAATGLPQPEAIDAQLQAALPDMLAGRPANADAGWQDATVDWFRGLVAMRPAGAVEGATPDAIIARLEAAVERRDFVAAKAELDTLPETMRRGAEPFAGEIDSLAAAQSFLTQLRAQVLTGEAGA